MKRSLQVLSGLVVFVSALAAGAADEHIRGVLEKTVKEGACAQASDALGEVYYVLKTPESDKTCNDLMGQRVVLTGVVEQRGGDTAYFLNLKKAEPYQPKLPPGKPPEPPTGATVPLPPPPAPAAGTKTEEPKALETPKVEPPKETGTPKAPETPKAGN